MEKRKWLWKRKSSERIPGETESSGSISSLSERYSDDQMEGFKGSPNSNNQSPEVTSKTMSNGEDVDDSIRRLTEKLSAALVNVSAKDDLVKQHAKVAEEAVAGWENAENEVAVLKQKLEAAVQQNSTLDDRVTHLDGAVKECVRQLRQAREEQEQKIHEAVMKKTREWESTKFELESQLLELQNKADAVLSESPAHSDPDLRQRLESLEKENSVLKLELLSQSEELEIRTIERDLSAQAAETASKQHLESIKKVAKLEAECRRLKAMASKSASINDHRSTGASSIYVESLTDSQSDSGERLDALDIDSRKMSGIDQNKCEPGCSDSWASALIAELDQFRNEKAGCKNIPTSSIEIGLMDDFLEMERLAALPETQHKNQQQESESAAKNSSCTESSLRAELDSMIRRTAELEEKLETMEREKAEIELEFSAKANETITLLRFELETMIHRATDLEEKLEKVEAEKAELRKANETITLLRFELETMIHGATDLEEKLEKVEAEKAELRNALNESQNSLEASQARLSEVESELEELQKGFLVANEAKHSVESRLITLEAEAQSMSMRSNSLEADLNKERSSSAQIKVKCQELEEELSRKKQEVELWQITSSKNEAKLKQESIDVAAGKLADCQKTIASLNKQLQSLATLEDFLIDTSNLPGFSGPGSLISSMGGEQQKLYSSEAFSPGNSDDTEVVPHESSINKNDGKSPPSASSSISSALSSDHVSSEKNRNGFAKFFTRSKNGIQLEI